MTQNRRPEAEALDGSSEEEEGVSSEENEGQEEEEEEESDSESEEKEDETSTPLPKKPSSSAPKKPGITQTSSSAYPLPQSSSSDHDSGSESDSPPNNTRRPDPNIKPIASKPMEEPPKATKKPRSKPGSATQAANSSTPTLKRPVVGENNSNRESKRAKKKTVEVDGDGGVKEDTLKKTGDDSKKQLFQRLWSEEDEIVILKGMIEYTGRKGADPAADMNAFHDFIKKSLHVDVSKSQLSDKVRRLKKKFENNASKGKMGEDRTFSKLHDQKVYDLSKKIWCGETNVVGGVDSTKVVNRKARKNQNQNQKESERANAASPKIDELPSPERAKEGTKMREEVEPSAGVVSVSDSVLLFNSSIGESRSLEEVILKGGLELISGPKRLELEEKWKKLRLEEVEFYLKRMDLIREQAKLVLEALKSSGH